MRISDWSSDVCSSDLEAVLACGIPFAGKPDHPLFAREMALLTEATAGIHRTGACSVDMAWVAAGRWDAYWERALMAWDMAPGVILVQEAGGVATSVDGSPLDLHGGNVRSDEHTSELQSLMRISYAVLCL